MIYMYVYIYTYIYIIPSLCTKMYQDSSPQQHFAKVREKLFIRLESTSNGSWDQCHSVFVFLAFALR